MPHGPKRGTTAQLGYGVKHQQLREQWRPKVEAGLVDCARCGHLIQPGRPWDLGHTDDRTGYTGPEHQRCNRRAGGANGAAVTNALRVTGVQTSREW